MTPRNIPIAGSRVSAAQGILKAAIHSHRSNAATHFVEPAVFVTISRQPGAGGIPFAHRLADELNRADGAQWTAWDHELIEKVSSEYHIAHSILEMIEERPHSWLDDLLCNFSGSEEMPDAVELRAFKRVTTTIRALAEAGHAVIVGRGGVFITSQMSGGIHLRLVAPLERRIQNMAEFEHLSPHDAAARVKAI
ncbi:MAG TPA: cytidylate kinase-like family protein, partial [Tepidisphaeraceae bacterium]|nr:cytidylate kinase-like family protein [Tepidisphaeraceae bacterium]